MADPGMRCMGSLTRRKTLAAIGAVLSPLGFNMAFAAELHSVSDLKGEWSGTLSQFSHDINDDSPVKLSITEISGDEFSGVMEWPSFDGCKTRVQGMFDGKLIKWTETAYLKGDDVVLYGLYVAEFKADHEIAGDWMDPKHTINPKGPRYGTVGASFVLRKQ
jgi:hypothetical protein